MKREGRLKTTIVIGSFIKINKNSILITTLPARSMNWNKNILRGFCHNLNKLKPFCIFKTTIKIVIVSFNYFVKKKQYFWGVVKKQLLN